jgi:predicted transglutaminase-like cysteine proteinase
VFIQLIRFWLDEVHVVKQFGSPRSSLAPLSVSRLRSLLPWLLLSLLLLSLCGSALVQALDWNRLQAEFRRLGGKPQDLKDWQQLLLQAKDVALPDKLKRVNDFFNHRIEFTDDQTAWGQLDYWATPMESLAKGKGDCEDYVIAKYFSLLHLQVPNENLRLIYVKAKLGNGSNAMQQAHMVLAYYANLDAEPLILDNLIGDIRPAGRRPDLQPVFSFNSQGIFAGVGANATLGPGGVGRLSRWQDLLQRAHAEGFE